MWFAIGERDSQAIAEQERWHPTKLAGALPTYMRLHLYRSLANAVKIDVIACMSLEKERILLPKAVTRVWVRLMRTHRVLLGAIEADLKAASLPPLSWYDVLLELSRATDGRLRQFEIEERILMAQYKLSRLIDRLEIRGFVKRETFDNDGRGRWVIITNEGRTVQAKMWEVYSKSLREHIGRKIDEESANKLADLLAKLTCPAS